MKRKIFAIPLLTTSMVMALSGCAVGPQGQQSRPVQTVTDIFASSDPCSSNDRNIGIAVGAAVGLAATLLLHQKPGTVLLGTAGGALVGGVVGYSLDSRRCELSKVAKANDLKIASAPVTTEKLGLDEKNTDLGLDVQVQNKPDEFVPGTTQLTPQARVYMGQIAKQYVAASDPEAAPNTPAPAATSPIHHKVLVVAHDAEGDDTSGNANLSEKQAKQVAEVMTQQGVPASDIYYQGAGASQPVASNATEQGREENRRIQIVDVPSDADLQQYLQTRSSNASLFSTAQPTDATGEAALVAPHTTVEGYASIDFGGVPTSTTGEKISIGTPVSRSMFDAITSANADTPLQINSCLTDTPHATSTVKNLDTGDDLSPRDYVFGFENGVWTAMVNRNYIAILHATVPVDTSAPIPTPVVEIYETYKGDTAQKANFKDDTPVNVYRGSEKTVYRIFVNGPAQCIDLVVPKNQFAGQANLYYSVKQAQYVAIPTFANK